MRGIRNYVYFIYNLRFLSKQKNYIHQFKKHMQYYMQKDYSPKYALLFNHWGQECTFKCARMCNIKKEAFHSPFVVTMNCMACATLHDTSLCKKCTWSNPLQLFLYIFLNIFDLSHFFVWYRFWLLVFTLVLFWYRYLFIFSSVSSSSSYV